MGDYSKHQRPEGASKVYPVPAYGEPYPLHANAISSTSAPTLETHGRALNPNTRDAIVTVTFKNPGAGANLDLYIRLWDGKSWFVVASTLDVQDLTGKRYQRRIPNVRQFGSKLDVQLANLVPDGGAVDVDLLETT